MQTVNRLQELCKLHDRIRYAMLGEEAEARIPLRQLEEKVIEQIRIEKSKKLHPSYAKES